jgi:hypothetical protein
MFLNALFSNTLSLSYSLKLRDHVSHPYSITGKIRVLYAVVFTFLDSILEHKRFSTELWQAFHKSNMREEEYSLT